MFFKIDLKLCDFAKKLQNFRELEAEPSNLRGYGGWGLLTPKTETAPMEISVSAPVIYNGNVEEVKKSGVY